MDYSADGQRRFYSKFEYHPNDKMAKTFNSPGELIEGSVFTPQSDGRFSASTDCDGISSTSEREARGSPYINKDYCRDKHSYVGNRHISTSAQQNRLTGVTSNMNEAFVVTPMNRSQDSLNKSLSYTHNGPEMYKTCSKPDKFNSKKDEVSFKSAEGEGELSSSDGSFRGSCMRECISLSSGEMVVRSHSFHLEEQSLVAFSSMEDSSISPAASCMSVPSESKLLSAALPDVSKTTTERKGHPSLGVTFTQANSVEDLTEEDFTAAFNSHVPLPSEGNLFMTFICESPGDQSKQSKLPGVDAEQLPQVSEVFTPELGRTFVSAPSGMQDSADDVHTSTPVQSIEKQMPNLSFSSPCIENITSPSLRLQKKQQISVRSKERPIAGVTPSICKVKKTELQRVTKSVLDTEKSKDLTRMSQHAAVLDSVRLQKILQINKESEANKMSFRTAAAKVMGRNMGVSASSKTSHPMGQINTRTAASGVTVKSLWGLDATSLPAHHPAVKDHAAEVRCSASSSEGMQASSSQVSEESVQQADNRSSASTAEKSSATSGQVDPKLTPKKVGASNKVGISSGSASDQDRPKVSTMWPRGCSESLSISRPPKEKKAAKVVTASFTVPRDDGVRSLTKAGNPKCLSRHKAVEEKNSPADTSREVKKISLVAEPSKSTIAGAQLNESKGRSQGHVSPRRGRGASLSQPPAASPRPSPLSTRPKLGAGSRISRTVGINSEGSLGSQAAEEQSTGNKLQQNAFKPPQTPVRPSLMRPPPTPTARPPRKIPGLGQDSKSIPVSEGAAHKSTPLKSAVLRAKLISSSSKNSGSAAVTAAFRPTSSSNKGSSSAAVSPPKKTTFGRAAGQTAPGLVDKNKTKSSSRQPQQQCSQPTKTTQSRTAAQGNILQDERRDQNIQQILSASNCRFQALAIVLQQTLAERDEATRQCRKLSGEVVSLKGELACSIHSSECLEREKKDLQAALQDATEKLQEEHKKELAELKQKLQAVFEAEWDNVHLTYQAEANQYKALVQQQMEELKASHEAMKLQLESSHAEQLQSVRQQHEMSLEEVKKVQTRERQSFEQALQDAEAALSKDSHTLYLEQELESLKVVLDLKNQQLHQQEKKLMEIGKLTEKNVKLGEILVKVQQENEDLKARMEKHAALSRQLSTEQAMLQESLQKESKVNKRLSMENEELLWKLHNGELSSPRRVSPSPTSPSHPFNLQSPRSSGFFSSSPVSPR